MTASILAENVEMYIQKLEDKEVAKKDFTDGQVCEQVR
jgi:hypothetical protein